MDPKQYDDSDEEIDTRDEFEREADAERARVEELEELEYDRLEERGLDQWRGLDHD